jgi:hypothetical protein
MPVKRSVQGLSCECWQPPRSYSCTVTADNQVLLTPDNVSFLNRAHGLAPLQDEYVAHEEHCYDAGDDGLVVVPATAGQDWLAHSFRLEAHAAMVQVVCNRLDEGDVTLAVPVFSEDLRAVGKSALPGLYSNRNLVINSPLAFVTLRNVIFKDGGRWISWCTNPGCEAFRSENPLFLARFFASEDWSHLDSDDVVSAARRVCRCGLAAMTARGTADSFSDGLYAMGEVGVLLHGALTRCGPVAGVHLLLLSVCNCQPLAVHK